MVSLLENIGILGVGNMGSGLAATFRNHNGIEGKNIFVYDKYLERCQELASSLGVQLVSSAEELFDKAGAVIVAVKPQDMMSTLMPLNSIMNEDHVVISIAAGLTISTLKKTVTRSRLLRVMPNTSIQIGQAVIGYYQEELESWVPPFMEKWFGNSGLLVELDDEDKFEALTVSSSSGIGFVLELMDYWQQWIEERGFESDIARAMAVQTFLGASQLASTQLSKTLETLRDQVTSKGGVTSAGLQSFRELELERVLRISFEKASMRDKQLNQSN